MSWWMRSLFIFGLLTAAVGASIFMILEAGSYYNQYVYESTENIHSYLSMGYWAALLNEVFMAIMAGVWLPDLKKKKPRLHPGNILVKFILVLLFCATVGGATIKVIQPKLEELQNQRNNKEIIDVLTSEVKDNVRSVETFIQQRQRTNTVLSVRKQQEIKEKLRATLQDRKSQITLWVEVAILILLRFSIQLANLTCVWLAGWVYREPKKSSLKQASENSLLEIETKKEEESRISLTENQEKKEEEKHLAPEKLEEKKEETVTIISKKNHPPFTLYSNPTLTQKPPEKKEETPPQIASEKREEKEAPITLEKMGGKETQGSKKNSDKKETRSEKENPEKKEPTLKADKKNIIPLPVSETPEERDVSPQVLALRKSIIRFLKKKNSGIPLPEFCRILEISPTRLKEIVSLKIPMNQEVLPQLKELHEKLEELYQAELAS